MEDKRITAEEILAEIDIDVNQMAQKVAGGRQPMKVGCVHPITSHDP